MRSHTHSHYFYTPHPCFRPGVLWALYTPALICLCLSSEDGVDRYDPNREKRKVKLRVVKSGAQESKAKTKTCS